MRYISAIGGMMKKIWLSVLTGMMVLILNSGVFAAEYVYKPYYKLNSGDDGNYYDLEDLNHYDAYEWGINLNNNDFYDQKIDFNTETITGATLYFDNIRNWNNDPNKLFVTLINTPNSIGVTKWDDGQTPIINYFDNRGTLLFYFENLKDRSQDIRVDITNLDMNYNDWLKDQPWLNETPDLTNRARIYMPMNGLTNFLAYTSDRIFGLGFDPDCNFYNDGITLKITTAITPPPGDHVPEPATLMLFGAGLLGLASRMRKKSQAA